jgi:hypothetical protein
MRKLQFHYKHLPKSWANLQKDGFVISDKKLSEIVDKLKKLPNKPITLYIQGGAGLLVEKTFDTINYFGVDYKKYFENIFEKDVESSLEFPAEADVIIIYNIGYEKAMNTAFSARILKGMIKQIKDSGKHVFLNSDMTATEFYKAYEIELVNKISIKEKEEEKIF